MDVHYTVSLARPHLHLLGVEMTVADAPEGPLRVRSPAWVPGHYVLMHNARFVQDLAAFVGGRPVPVRKTDRQTWQVEKGAARRVTLRYDVFANTLSSAACFFDDTQCHVNGGNAFLYVDGHQDAACSLSLREKPRGWEVATGLEREGPNRWRAATYDDLIDRPLKIGTLHHRRFRVRGCTHHVVVSDLGDTVDRLPRYVRETKAFVTWLADLFGGLPYEEYWFLCDFHPTRCMGGALEHANSTHLALPVRLDSEEEEDYERILAVTCHEFFHLWNVKRIRPRPLGPFDYSAEAHTPDLWVAEGFTDYYAWYALLRSGVLDARRFLRALARIVDALHDMPGRLVTSVREASWDTWTHSPWYAARSFGTTNAVNRFVNYYTKGAVVGALLDVEIRAATRGEHGLEEVMRGLWARADAPEGFAPGEVEAEVERLAGAALRRRLEAWVGGRGDLPLRRTFAKAGLRLRFERPTREEERHRRRRKILGGWGMEVDDASDPPRLHNVEPDGPAARAGLTAGDVLLAVDGHRLTKEDWRRLLARCRADVPVPLAFFRYDRLREVEVTPRPDGRKVARFEVPTAAPPPARRVRETWLGPVEPGLRTGPAAKPRDASRGARGRSR